MIVIYPFAVQLFYLIMNVIAFLVSWQSHKKLKQWPAIPEKRFRQYGSGIMFLGIGCLFIASLIMARYEGEMDPIIYGLSILLDLALTLIAMFSSVVVGLGIFQLGEEEPAGNSKK